MPIRFACPSCQQPIEIDEQWAGQAVACPYCRNIVTSPSQSTWPGADIPVATPAGGFAPPPPPRGTVVAPAGRRSGAGWALTLALTSAVLSVLAYVAFATVIGNAILDKVGRDKDLSSEQMRREYQEMLASGSIPRSPFSSAAVLIGAICGLGGIATGIVSLVRGDPRRGMAISAILISTAFVVCQIALGMLLVAAAVGQPLAPA